MKLNKLFVFITFFLLLALFAAFGCQNQSLNAKSSQSVTETTGTQNTGNKTIDAESTDQEDNQSSSEQQPGYLDEYEGLHITGSPIDVDVKTYRLEISGEVDKALSLTFEEIKNLPSVRIYSELDCPGYFTDKGYWTGVKIIDLLNIAGLKENAERVKFSSIDGSYSQILTVEGIRSEDYLIAYMFNDKEFSKYHGFPLRVVVKGLPGSLWVKWLGKIEVLA